MSKLEFSLAPMMERTTMPFRYLVRLLSPDILLYTEMISAEALIYGDAAWLLSCDIKEGPLILQLGSSCPDHAYQALKIAESFPFSGYNLNAGCPSERVQNRLIGAALMAEPLLVREILQAMRQASKKTLSIKQRIGIQSKELELTSYSDLYNFTTNIADVVDLCTVHARIAILEGLSPKENREIPPLRYKDVFTLQQNLPLLPIELNGGIRCFEDVEEQRQNFSKLMLGRWAWEDSWSLARLSYLYGSNPINLTRYHVVMKYLNWLESQELEKRSLSYWLNPLINLLHAKPHSKKWRRALSAPFSAKTNAPTLIRQAMSLIEEPIWHEAVADG